MSASPAAAAEQADYLKKVDEQVRRARMHTAARIHARAH